MSFKSTIFNFLMIGIMSFMAFNPRAIAEQNLPSLVSNIQYENLMKSFLLRASVGQNPFYENGIMTFREPILRTLVLVYIFSELKSGRELPEELKKEFPMTTQKDVIDELNRMMGEAKKSVFSHYSRFDEVNSASLRILFVASQTISEFSPYLNIKDKALRDTLVKGYGNLAEALAGHYLEGQVPKSNASKPYLKPAFVGIQQMNSSLTPPNILQKMISKFQKPESPVVNQNGTGPSCSRFFQ